MSASMSVSVRLILPPHATQRLWTTLNNFMLTSIHDQNSGKYKLLHSWIILVVVKQHLVQLIEWMDLPNVYHEYSPRLDSCPHTPHNMLFFTLPTLPYRGTSLIRNCFLLGTYSRPIPRFKRLDWKQFRERPMALA